MPPSSIQTFVNYSYCIDHLLKEINVTLNTGVTLDIQIKKHILYYTLLLLKFSKIILIYSFEAIYQHYF